MFRKSINAVVGLALIGAGALIPNNILAADDDPFPNKVGCECTCVVRGEDGHIVAGFTKTFRAPGDDGTQCYKYDKSKCNTVVGSGRLKDCESVVERSTSAGTVAPQKVAPDDPDKQDPDPIGRSRLKKRVK